VFLLCKNPASTVVLGVMCRPFLSALFVFLFGGIACHFGQCKLRAAADSPPSSSSLEADLNADSERHPDVRPDQRVSLGQADADAPARRRLPP